LIETQTSSDQRIQRPPERPLDGTTKLPAVLKRELRWEELYLDVLISETKIIYAHVKFINLARYSILLELLRFLPIPRQFQPTSFMTSRGALGARAVSDSWIMHGTWASLAWTPSSVRVGTWWSRAWHAGSHTRPRGSTRPSGSRSTRHTTVGARTCAGPG
jgi:hypothetical protein